MRSGAGDPFDDEGSDRPGPQPLVLAIWAGVAAVAVLAAVIALTFGGPGTPPAPTLTAAAPAPAPAQPAPVAATPTAATPAAVAERFRDMPPVSGGRSDFVQAADGTGAEDIAGDIAQLKIENAALRQTNDVLRGQIASLAERVERLEGKLGDFTGSLGAPAPTRQALPAPTPSVPVTRSDAADTRREEVGMARTEFGIELGTYEDLTAVRGAWRKLLNDHPGLFGGLDALATVRDRGGATELLLVAGPFPNAADAAARCTKVEEAGLSCLPAFFLGQALAIR